MGLLFFAISWANSIDLSDNVQQFYIPVTRNHQRIIPGHIVVKERPIHGRNDRASMSCLGNHEKFDHVLVVRMTSVHLIYR